MATNSVGYSVDDYRVRHGRFRDSDAEKDEMISELIENFEKVKKECRQTSLDLESERVGRRLLQGRVEELEALTRARDFVLVLIDADADDYIFRERFLAMDEGGGKDAADELHARIKDYVKGLHFDAENTKIVVRAYADFKHLQAACIKNGKMMMGSNLNVFAHGFNQRLGLFDFVDIGTGKEAADNKIRECLSFYLDDWQCKHVVFGACHDSGYAPFLGQFAADPAKRDRITLLQGVTIHPRIAALGFRHTLKLDSVFGSQKTSAVPALPSTTPATIVSPSSSPAHGFLNPAALSERLGPVLHGQNGKRMDKILNVDVSSPYLQVLRKLKLCQWFYLRGRCEGCDRNHLMPPLKAREFDCLWYLARYGACNKIRKGKECDDPKCVYGHEAGCQIGSGSI